jgi:hypothetical protein
LTIELNFTTVDVKHKMFNRLIVVALSLSAYLSLGFGFFFVTMIIYYHKEKEEILQAKPNGLIYLHIFPCRITHTSLFTSGPRKEKP